MPAFLVIVLAVAQLVVSESDLWRPKPELVHPQISPDGFNGHAGDFIFCDCAVGDFQKPCAGMFLRLMIVLVNLCHADNMSLAPVGS